MTRYLINGKNKLFGEVKVQRAKNSALVLIAASILVKGRVKIADCPKINDVFNMIKIIKRIGGHAEFESDGLVLDCTGIFSSRLPDKPSCEVRASFFTAGALLSRFKTASMIRPGGCKIGSRPVDIHLEGFAALGADVGETEDRINIFALKLKGTRFRLRYPSVGATENLVMAACLSEGVTVLENCASEPEIKDLQNFLNLCGAKIAGAGTRRITVVGVNELHGGVEFTPLFDRIEAGTILLGALGAGGEVSLKGVNAENIYALTEKIKNNACKIYINNDNIIIYAHGAPTGFGTVVTAPYPLFPTDLQPQLTAVAASAFGRTVVTETVFDNRFGFCGELIKMGADIAIAGDTAIVDGKHLFGATVCAEDLRGAAALTIAALIAEGDSKVFGIEHLERGYEDLYGKFRSLGAKISRKS